MDLTELIILFLCGCLVMISYFPLARRLKLIDKPNDRSSHLRPTYRGAGIIFLIVYLLGTAFYKEHSWTLSLGLLLAAFSGFIDDFKGLSAGSRALLYAVALLLCLGSIDQIWIIPWYYKLLIMIIGLGTVNAYNFMDGINGISVIYTIVLLLSLLYFDYRAMGQVSIPVISSVLLACVIFGFFNLRSKALAFMGDVGSVFLGTLTVYFIVDLIWQTREISWLLLVLVYGVDSIFTIVGRLMNRENIFKAHRRHLYQLLSNELGWSQILVAVIYGLVQLIVNYLLLLMNEHQYNPMLGFAFIALSFGAIYLFIRWLTLRSVNKSMSLS